LAVLLASLAISSASADDGRRGARVLFGQDLLVRAGETIDGDVVVFGGNVTVEAGGRIIGDLVVFGGDLSIAGEVTGDVAAIGGDVTLKATAVVRQDVAAVGGNLEREPGATVRGSIVGGPSITVPGIPRWRFGRFDLGWFPTWTDLAINLGLNVFQAVLIAVALAALAIVAVALFPQQTEVVRTTVQTLPVQSFGLGLLTFVAAIILTIPVALLTICLGAFLGWGAILVATLFGFAAIGLGVGERLHVAFKATTSPVAAAGLGTLVLALLLGLLGAVPFVNCFTWVFWVFVDSLGLGAVLMSRFGTRPPQAVTPPPAPPGAPAPQTPSA